MLFFFLVTVCGSVTVLVAILLVYFSVRYRRRPGEVGNPPETHPSELLEWSWTLAPLVIFAVIFVWGAKVYFDAYRPPDDAATIYVVGKQWMWKFQHPEGQREINTLHVPLGRPIRLLLTSEDVIHSLFVPDFRIHMDLLPERYTLGLVPGHAAGDVSPVLLAVLRHEPRRHDRHGDRDGAGRLREVAAPGGRRIDGPAGPQGVPQVPLRQLPQRRRRSPCPGAGRPLRPAGGPQRRRRGEGRRELHPRIDHCIPAPRSWPATRTSCRPSRGR